MNLSGRGWIRIVLLPALVVTSAWIAAGQGRMIFTPAGWEVSGVSQSGTIGTARGRAFVSLINLNAENSYKGTIRARRGATTPPG